MSKEELRKTVSHFGEVISAKIYDEKEAAGSGRSGLVEFKDAAGLELAVKKLDRRRVEGWEKRLQAYVVESAEEF